MVTRLTQCALTGVSSWVTKLYFHLHVGSCYSARVDTFMFCLSLVCPSQSEHVYFCFKFEKRRQIIAVNITLSGLISPLPTVRPTFSDFEVLLNWAKIFLIIGNKNLSLRVESLDLTATMFLDRNTKTRWELHVIAVFTLSRRFLVRRIPCLMWIREGFQWVSLPFA